MTSCITTKIIAFVPSIIPLFWQCATHEMRPTHSALPDGFMATLAAVFLLVAAWLSILAGWECTAVTAGWEFTRNGILVVWDSRRDEDEYESILWGAKRGDE